MIVDGADEQVLVDAAFVCRHDEMMAENQMSNVQFGKKRLKIRILTTTIGQWCLKISFLNNRLEIVRSKLYTHSCIINYVHLS